MTEMLRSTGAPLLYIVSAVCFFIGLKSITRLRTAGRGQPLLVGGLVLALVGTVLEVGTGGFAALLLPAIVGGVVGGGLARSLPESPVPARVASIPGFAGAASALAAMGALISSELPTGRTVAAGLAVLFGAAGLLVSTALSYRKRETPGSNAGGALVVVLAGWAAVLLGFALSNALLIIIGSVAGMAGVALGRIMGAASGRSFVGLLTGGAQGGALTDGYSNIRSCGTEEAAMVLETASSVAIIPGFGMAAAQAQHAVKEMAELLEKRGARVTYVIHPAAGCVPGHMNIVLDEANVPHNRLLELDGASAALQEADAVVVVGANDVVNPAAASEPQSPVYGMPVPDLSRTRSVFIIKRSLRPGASGVRNALFEQPNTTLLFGDAKKVAQALVAELKGAGARWEHTMESQLQVLGVVIFVVAAFVGHHVVHGVPPLLHTPLMSATNAISAISVVAAVVIAGSEVEGVKTTLGVIAVAAATTNVVGGFLITDRMLKMFKGGQQAPGKGKAVEGGKR